MLVVTFFNDLVLGGKTLFYYDIAIQNYPFRQFWAEGIRSGEFPLWCPYIYGGFPLFAEGQAGPFYPLHILLYYLLPTTAAFNVSVLLHLFLAGLFLYLFMREVGTGTAGSFIAAIAYTFSGCLVARIIHTNMIYGAAWTPLLLLLIERYMKTGRLRNIAIAGFVLSMQLLCSHPCITTSSVLLLSGYYLFRSVSGDVRAEGLLRWAGLAIILGIGTGLAAIQILPTLELVSLSERAQVGAEFQGFGSLPPKNLFTFFLPNLFGSPANDSYWGALSSDFYREWACYVGIVPLLLASVAILRRPGRTVAFFGTAAMIALLAALGDYSFVHKMLQSLPVLGGQRIPGRYVYIVVLALCILGGLGLEKVLSERRKTSSESESGPICAIIGFFVLFVALLCGWAVAANHTLFFGSAGATDVGNSFIGILRADILRCFIVTVMAASFLVGFLKLGVKAFVSVSLLAALLFIDLYLYGEGFNPGIEPDFFRTRPRTVRKLQEDPGLYRVFRIVNENWGRRSKVSRKDPFTPGWEAGVEGYGRAMESIAPNAGILYRVSTLAGFGPLAIARYNELMGIGGFLGSRSAYKMNRLLLDLCNVKYVLADNRMRVPDLTKVYGDHSVGLDIYENAHALQRAFMVPSYRIPGSDSKILEAMRKGDFDPRKVVLLEEVIEGLRPLVKDGTPGDPFNAGDVIVAGYGTDEIVLETSTDRDGILFMSEVHYPGWHVEVDGIRGKLLRANYVFRAVFLNAGVHEVRFVFEPGSLVKGSLITFIVILVLLISGLIIRLRLSRVSVFQKTAIPDIAHVDPIGPPVGPGTWAFLAGLLIIVAVSVLFHVSEFISISAPW